METISTLVDALLRVGTRIEGLFLKIRGGGLVTELRKKIASSERVAGTDLLVLKENPYVTASLLVQLLLGLEEPLLFEILQPIASATRKHDYTFFKDCCHCSQNASKLSG
jgi:hypothetical protein